MFSSQEQEEHHKESIQPLLLCNTVKITYKALAMSAVGYCSMHPLDF